MKNPKVSIIMPVYNSEAFLDESINSILNQTFTDFEFLIFNDGSTDDSLKIIENYQKKDSRIKLFSSPKNMGYVYHLNEGLRIAKGDYIARMDADDVSAKERLDTQLKILELNSRLGVVGSSTVSIDEFGNEKIGWKLDATPEETRVHFLFTNYLIHPSVLMRKSAIPKEGYRESLMPSEDFDLWTRILDSYDIYSTPKALIKYRTHNKNTSSLNKQAGYKNASMVLKHQLNKIGIEATEDQVEIHHKISDFQTKDFDLKKIDDWFEILWEANKKTMRYRPYILLSTILGRRLIISRKKIIGLLFRYMKDLKTYEIFFFLKLSLYRFSGYLKRNNNSIVKLLIVNLSKIIWKIKVRIEKNKIKFSKNPRPTSYPYISGDGFRSLAQHIHEKNNFIKPEEVKSSDILFVESELLIDFFKDIHPFIKNRYILISHNGDANIGLEYLKYIDEKIIHWFAQNCLMNHPKMTPIPIGLENAYHGNAGKIKLFKKFSKRKKSEKQPKILVGFSMETNLEERQRAFNTLSTIQNTLFLKHEYNQEKYIDILHKCMFVASPPGNGNDCHRTWEALYVGTIPIVLNSKNMLFFEENNLPIWVVKDYCEIIGTDIEKKYNMLLSKFKSDNLYLDYWIKKINFYK